MSPAFLQLFSLGACIAISLGMAAKQMGLSLNAFSVFVTSKKAEDLPSRFGGFSVIVSKNIFIDKQIAINLINKAKTICTVSNSLNAEVLIYLSDEA